MVYRYHSWHDGRLASLIVCPGWFCPGPAVATATRSFMTGDCVPAASNGLSRPDACAKAPRSRSLPGPGAAGVPWPRGWMVRPFRGGRPGTGPVGAGVVELADTPDLGSGGASRGGSSPSARTTWPDGRFRGRHSFLVDKGKGFAGTCRLPRRYPMDSGARSALFFRARTSKPAERSALRH